MYELFGSVNPRPTDDLFGLLYPAGLLSLAINAALTGACLLAYSLTFWLLRSHFSIDSRTRRDLAIEIVSIAALGCSFALFPVYYSLLLLIRCFTYISLATNPSKSREGMRGKPLHIQIKIGFLRFFLILLSIGFVAIPFVLSYMFSGIVEVYYDTVYVVGVVLAIALNVVKKPQGMPGFLTSWRPPVQLKRAFQVAVIAFPVLCSAVILNSAVIKYHAAAPAAPTSGITSSTRIVTYNIRNGMAWELNLANNWENRKDEFSAYFSALDADIVGVEEAYLFQLEDILSRVNAISCSTGRFYQFTGFGRDDGVHGGEHSAIIFDATRFKFIDGDTFWLSYTPDLPSKQWEPSNYRVCTWARLERIATGAQLVVFCTHYATSGYVTFHEPASRLIKERIGVYAGGLPVFLMGDFNMYNTTNAFSILRTYGTIPLVDTYMGPKTYSMAPNFDATYTTTSNRKIDFVLVNALVSVTNCTIPKAWYGANQTYSDHYPVVVDCVV